MKKSFLITAILVLFFISPVFAEENTVTESSVTDESIATESPASIDEEQIIDKNTEDDIKTPEELQEEVYKNQKKENLEKAEKKEKVPVKFLIKADLGVIGTNLIFSLNNLNDINYGLMDIIRFPLVWEFVMNESLSLSLKTELVNILTFPVAGAFLGGITYYPLNHAPHDLYLSFALGGTVGLINSFVLQPEIGWQFVTKSKNIISLGLEASIHPTSNQETSKASGFFWNPGFSISLGRGF